MPARLAICGHSRKLGVLRKPDAGGRRISYELNDLPE
jgi:hypothetical protein